MSIGHPTIYDANITFSSRRHPNEPTSKGIIYQPREYFHKLYLQPRLPLFANAFSPQSPHHPSTESVLYSSLEAIVAGKPHQISGFVHCQVVSIATSMPIACKPRCILLSHTEASIGCCALLLLQICLVCRCTMSLVRGVESPPATFNCRLWSPGEWLLSFFSLFCVVRVCSLWGHLLCHLKQRCCLLC